MGLAYARSRTVAAPPLIASEFSRRVSGIPRNDKGDYQSAWVRRSARPRAARRARAGRCGHCAGAGPASVVRARAGRARALRLPDVAGAVLTRRPGRRCPIRSPAAAPGARTRTHASGPRNVGAHVGRHAPAGATRGPLPGGAVIPDEPLGGRIHGDDSGGPQLRAAILGRELRFL